MAENILQVLQIIFADLILSGDNAIVIGMAAASVEPQYRRKAIILGMAMAALLRIIFAMVASYLIAIPGILVLGGLLLTWVCWRFYNDIRVHNRSSKVNVEAGDAFKIAEAGETGTSVPLRSALITITLADVSMSIDNVLAIAAIARDDRAMLVFGLVLAILLMAFCATIIMRVLHRYPVLSWVGLVFLVYLSGYMLYDGLHQLMPYILG